MFCSLALRRRHNDDEDRQAQGCVVEKGSVRCPVLKCQLAAGRGGSLREAEAGGLRGQEIETVLVNMVKPRLY